MGRNITIFIYVITACYFSLFLLLVCLLVNDTWFEVIDTSTVLTGYIVSTKDEFRLG